MGHMKLELALFSPSLMSEDGVFSLVFLIPDVTDVTDV